MNQELIDSYQPGGIIFQRMVDRFGAANAAFIAQAALSGDRYAVNAAIEQVRYSGERLPTNTGSIFWEQLTTDPFAAPLASANVAIGTLAKSASSGLFRNPWVLLVMALGAIAFAVYIFGIPKR
jgi:hypothetical protein